MADTVEGSTSEVSLVKVIKLANNEMNASRQQHAAYIDRVK